MACRVVVPDSAVAGADLNRMLLFPPRFVSIRVDLLRVTTSTRDYF
jgi:hypothetical protein